MVASVLIGADGTRSAIRKEINPNERERQWGALLSRGNA